jgi:ABC-type transporter Mla subunit MlaD
LAAVLADKSGGVIAALNEKGEQFAGDITRATEQALNAIDERGLGFARTMLDNSGEISRIINAAGESAAQSVSRTMNELNETTQNAIVRSRETAASAIKEMMETHGMLRADTTALFERLREANIMLQEVLSGAHENMNGLESTLMLRVSEFVTAMNEVTGATGEVTNRVESTITNFRGTTERLVNDLGQLAYQFNAHGRDLAQAIELIERSNTRSAESVNERRDQLDSLVSTLDVRSMDIEQRLSRFSSLLDESLESASTRAREVARLISESSSEGSRAITEQYSRVRENAENERERSAEAMRAIYEQASGETNVMFREASERFAQVMRDMKQMASEMQRELESTRSELRRGIFDLPQETAENAAQMRRVIVDQIEALAELNRIVARHGRNLDAVEPARRPGREEPSLAIGSGRSEIPAAAPRSEPPPRAASPRDDIGSFAPTSRRVESASSLSAAPQASTGRGWLSDLLSRASQEEEQPRESLREQPRNGEERSARHSIESLDSLSVDIARMIDHEAATDLWDRYKRGERNVFTRRLYTLQGQKAFDDIRRKYRADREFKQTVDRYIGEFERLLDEVARDDRGQVMARTYLTSETGKVYTMLAHAAGRFD